MLIDSTSFLDTPMGIDVYIIHSWSDISLYYRKLRFTFHFVWILIKFHRRLPVLTRLTKYCYILEKCLLTAKVPAITSENAYNIQGAVNKELFNENIHLCAHTLNLISKDVLKLAKWHVDKIKKKIAPPLLLFFRVGKSLKMNKISSFRIEFNCLHGSVFLWVARFNQKNNSSNE